MSEPYTAEDLAGFVQHTETMAGRFLATIAERDVTIAELKALLRGWAESFGYCDVNSSECENCDRTRAALGRAALGEDV